MSSSPSYRGIPLPPLSLGRARLVCAALGFVPQDMLKDAIQEVWLLHVQKRNVVRGLGLWRQRELGRNPGMTCQERGSSKTEPFKSGEHQGGVVKRQF